MTKLDDAYNRLSQFRVQMAEKKAFTWALRSAGYDGAGTASFDAAIATLCQDLRLVLDAVEDLEDRNEILRDLTTDESERRAIGGGPNWRERHEKTWARAMELFEP